MVIILFEFSPPFQPKRKNVDLRKKGNLHWEQEKVKKTGGK